MLDNLEENQIKRDELGRLLPGQPSLNPLGRPRGQSLKEYWKQKFAEMSDEEKEAFTRRVDADMIWQMAEGRPTADDKLKLDIPQNIIDLLRNVDTGESKEIPTEDTV